MDERLTPAERRHQEIRRMRAQALAMNFFDRYGLPYLAIDRAEHARSARMEDAPVAIPDFMVLAAAAGGQPGGVVFVAVRNADVLETAGAILLDRDDVTRLTALGRTFGHRTLVGFALEERYLYFVDAETIPNLSPTVVLGQCHTLMVDAGPAHGRPSRPRHALRGALFAFDNLLRPGVGINRAVEDIVRLFAPA